MTRLPNDDARAEQESPVRPGLEGEHAPFLPRILSRRRVLGVGWGWLGVLAIIVVLLVGIAGWGGFRGIRHMTGGPGGIPTATVQRGTLKVIVLADGTIRSDKTIDIKSRIEGMTRILEIVPESTRIDKAGELLARLDTSDLEKQRATQEIKVKQAKGAAELAQRELEIQRGQSASEVNKAELAKKFAEIELDKYINGDWPQQRQEAENAITIANEELQRAQDKLAWSEKLAVQGYISGSELTADQLALKKSELDVELAKLKLEVLKKYTYPKELARRQSDLNEATAELERVKAKAAANEAKALTERDTRQESYRLEEEQLAKTIRQLAAGTITAPQPGLVVYASTGRWRGPNQQVIDVGYQVREGETIISLPDLSLMVADVSVPEAKRTAVEEGQSALVTVEAQPNTYLRGRVKSRGVMPVQQEWWRRGDVQQFQVVIQIEDPPSWLLPGLRCTAQILVRQLDSVLMLPVQAVFQRGETHFCFVNNPGGQVRAVPVLIGLDDDRMVEIRAGLEVGWQALLAEPEGAGKIPLEKPTFAPPAPTAPPPLEPSTQPAGLSPANGPSTQPEAGEFSDAEFARFIARLRERDPERADQLSKMSPEERRQAMEEARRRRPGRQDRPGGTENRPGQGPPAP